MGIEIENGEFVYVSKLILRDAVDAVVVFFFLKRAPFENAGC